MITGKTKSGFVYAIPEKRIHNMELLDALVEVERGSDAGLSDALNLPRPGVTRTVKEMERKGYLQKQVSAEDGQVTYLLLTDAGRLLSKKYDSDYFQSLAPCLDDIPEADAECTIRTIEKFYQVMCERRNVHEK